MDYWRNRVCPAARANSLDIRFRRWFQSPTKILAPFIREGMTVLDFGCGPGYFTIDLAHLVGKSGWVIAADLQEVMLRKLRVKICETDLEECIKLHRCEEDRIGLSEKVDFVLAFYVIHEIPNQAGLFKELGSILRPSGQVLVAEPPLHVPKSAFVATIEEARKAGFIPAEGPRVFFSRTVILKRS
jgi:ubiquinone/menaquinone biosynthesis C-methylase UbiE